MSIPQHVSYVAWLSLPVETRAKLAVLFEIERTGESVVHVGAMVDGLVSAEQKSDGYTPKDLAVISLERMQEITGTKSDNFYDLFGKIVKDIDEYVESDAIPDAFKEEDLAEAVGAGTAKDITKSKDGKNAKTKKAKAD